MQFQFLAVSGRAAGDASIRNQPSVKSCAPHPLIHRAALFGELPPFHPTATPSVPRTLPPTYLSHTCNAIPHPEFRIYYSRWPYVNASLRNDGKSQFFVTFFFLTFSQPHSHIFINHFLGHSVIVLIFYCEIL